MFDKSQAGSIIGQELRTSDGDKIGKIGQVYLDDYHDQPEWVTVNTGLFGTNESFVPLAEASLVEGGVAVPYNKDKIKDAPNIDESGHLTEAEEQDLYTYYDIPFTTEGSTFADTSRVGRTGDGADAGRRVAGDDDVYDVEQDVRDRGDRDRGDRDRDDRDRDGVYDDVQQTAVGHDTSGETTDDAMTRSEERLNVGTERVETGKARLRKWVETENVQVDVPVRTEKATLVSEPITEQNRGQAFDGPGISEEEHVVTLNAERPVVSTETVPVERVRVDTQVEESVQTVSGDVRKEQIAFEDETVDTTASGDEAKHRK